MSDKKSIKSSEFDDVLKQQAKLQRSEKIKNDLPLYLMMLPGILYIIVNNYLHIGHKDTKYI